MSATEIFYRNYFLEQRHGFRRPRKLNLREQRLLRENQDAHKALETLISEVTMFFDEKKAEVIGLDVTSPERAIVEAALGMLKQATDPASTANDIRSRISTLRDGLRDLVEGADTSNNLYRYVNDVIASLSNLYVQAGEGGDDALGGGPDEAPVGDAGPPPDEEGGPDDSPPPSGKPESPDKEGEEGGEMDLAQSLGLAK